ncbi:MAG: hypothetical protein ACRDL7_13160, partial [Gaiellaceae bacterium]
ARATVRHVRKLAWIAVLGAAAAIAVSVGSAPASAHARCSSHPKVGSLPRWRSAGLLRADIDGDGRPDTVTVRYAPHVPGRCAFYLVASTATRLYSLQLGPRVLFMSKEDVKAPVRRSIWAWAFPTVEAIVDLGGRGNVVVLSVGEGAANLGVSLFGVVDGRLRLLPVGGRRNLWPGGSVMDQSRLRCRSGGPLQDLFVDNVATRKHPNRWRFSSVTYRRRGTRFVALAHRAVIGSNRKASRAGERAGINGYEFAGCSLRRNSSFK